MPRSLSLSSSFSIKGLMGPGRVIPLAARRSAQGWRISSLTSSTTLSRLKRAKVEMRGFWKPVVREGKVVWKEVARSPCAESASGVQSSDDR